MRDARLEFSNLNQEDEEECRGVIKKRRVTYKHEALWSLLETVGGAEVVGPRGRYGARISCEISSQPASSSGAELEGARLASMSEP